MRGESNAEEIVTVGIGDGCSEAQNVQKRPSERERLKAAELLGKRFGLFSEQNSPQGEKELPALFEALEANEDGD